MLNSAFRHLIGPLIGSIIAVVALSYVFNWHAQFNDVAVVVNRDDTNGGYVKITAAQPTLERLAISQLARQRQRAVPDAMSEMSASASDDTSLVVIDWLYEGTAITGEDLLNTLDDGHRFSVRSVGENHYIIEVFHD